MVSWRVLGPFGGQVGPKMEPRGFQGRKTRFVPPMFGAKLGPHFSHFHHQGGSKEAWRPTWMTCCVQTPIFRRKGVSQDIKNKQNHCIVVRFQVFHLSGKSCSREGSGAPFWSVLGAKLGHVGHQVGLKWLLKITPKIGW